MSDRNVNEFEEIEKTEVLGETEVLEETEVPDEIENAETEVEEVEIFEEKVKPSRKKGLRGRNFKQGLYSSVVAVFVLAIVILFNLFIGQLNLKIDLTKEEVYTLTEETKELVSNVEDEIMIYYLVKEDDEYEVLRNVIDQYSKLPNISTEWKDPELYPQFASKYTTEQLEGNDVIVVNETTGASKFIPFTDMYITDYQVNYTTANYDYSYTLDAEGQITAAIQYVTSAKHTTMYIVSAHGEVELGEKVLDLIAKSNVDIAELDVLSQNEIPEDCDLIFINGPATDISEEELEMYKKYLDNGGKAIFTVAYPEKDTPNYYALLDYYGVEVTKGVVLEENGNYMNNYPTYLLAGFASVTSDISANFTMDDYVIMPIASIMKTKDASQMRGTITVTEIVNSSEGSYGKTNPDSNVIEKEDIDPAGPFSLVVQATDTYKDKSSKVAVFASPYMTTDDWIDYYECSNIDLFLDTIDWMSDKQSVAIPKRNLDAVYLEVPQAAATKWAVVTVILIPLCILITGFFIWYRRRKH